MKQNRKIRRIDWPNARELAMGAFIIIALACIIVFGSACIAKVVYVPIAGLP